MAFDALGFTVTSDRDYGTLYLDYSRSPMALGTLSSSQKLEKKCLCPMDAIVTTSY